MYRKIGIVLALVLVIVGVFMMQKESVPVPTPVTMAPHILSEETATVTKEEMLTAIEGMDLPFPAVNKEERLATESFDAIVLKKTVFVFGDITVEVGAYFDVDPEGKMVKDTLFAWSLPSDTQKGYEQFAITELVESYPAETVSIRVRGAYGGAGESMDLQYGVS